MAPLHCMTCMCADRLDRQGPQESWSSAQTEAYEEIVTLEDALLSARARFYDLLRQRNTSMASICRLPEDVLGEIFLFCRDAYPNHPWLSLSHVCRTWRDTALSRAVLWSSPNLAYGQLTLMTIDRSQQSSLRLQLSDRPCFYHPLTFATLVTRLGRQAGIDVCARVTEINLKGRQQVIDRASRFIIESSQSLRSLSINTDWEFYNIPSDVLAATYSQLCILRLYACHPMLETSLLRSPQLRILQLDFDMEYEYDETYPPLVEPMHLLELLGCLPQLEEFGFQGWLEDLPIGANPPTVHLPRLTSCRFFSGADSHHLVLQHIHIPSTCKMYVKAEQIDGLVAVVNLFKAVVLPGHRVYALKLETRRDDPDVYLNMLACPEEYSHNPPHLLQCQGTALAECSDEDGAQEWKDFARSIGHVLCGPGTTTVCIVLGAENNWSGVWDILSASSDVTKLHVDFTGTYNRIRSIENIVIMLSEGDLPKLETLVLEGLGRLHDAEQLTSLVDVLRARSTIHGVFRRLHFENCAIPGGVYEDLAKMSPVVSASNGSSLTLGTWANRVFSPWYRW